MADEHMTQVEKDAETLFDYSAGKPGGFTHEDVTDDLGWKRPRFKLAARELRLTLASDTISLVCEPQVGDPLYLWRLVGNYDDARPYIITRERDMAGRIASIRAVAQSLAGAHDGRTIQGRKARLVESTLGNLLVQLDVLDMQS